jgi:hypothetical protein
MKHTTMLSIAAGGLLLGSSVISFAQTDTKPGASGFAPGQQDRSGTTQPGASEFAPGQRQKSGEGAAKDFAPGQQMKGSETDASAGTDTKGKPSTTGSDVQKKSD